MTTETPTRERRLIELRHAAETMADTDIYRMSGLTHQFLFDQLYPAMHASFDLYDILKRPNDEDGTCGYTGAEVRFMVGKLPHFTETEEGANG